jgi:hypothetical protein
VCYKLHHEVKEAKGDGLPKEVKLELPPSLLDRERLFSADMQ